MQVNPYSNSPLLPPTAKSLPVETSAFPPPELSAGLESESGGSPPAEELKEAFQDFVGQTFFGELIKSFRSTQQPSAYFHGGRAEEIFQGQFDQVLSEKLSESSAEQIADPMFELFMLKRNS